MREDEQSLTYIKHEYDCGEYTLKLLPCELKDSNARVAIDLYDKYYKCPSEREA